MNHSYQNHKAAIQPNFKNFIRIKVRLSIFLPYYTFLAKIPF